MMRRVVRPAFVVLAAVLAAETLFRLGDTQIPPGTIVYGDAAVAGGTLYVGGTVTGNATAIAGSVRVSGHVGGDVRATAGNVILDSTAVVEGTVQSTGGSVRIAPGAVIRKLPPGARPAPQVPRVPAIPLPSPVPRSPGPWSVPGLPPWLPFFGIVAAWKLIAGVLLLLGLVTFVGTAWATAAMFPGATSAVALALERSPASCVVAGILVWLLIGPVTVLLILSVAGVLLMLLLLAALLIGIQLGLTAVAVLVGHRLRPGRLAVEAVIGALLLVVAFAVPHLGWLAGLAATTWGTGGVVLTIMERRRRGSVPPATSAPSAPPSAVV
jgi:hypothetical protein